MNPASAEYPVSSVDDAYNTCHPDIPLEAGDPRCVDLTRWRGGLNLTSTLARRIQRSPAPLFHKQLVTGHRGCGKSTELKQLQARLREQRHFVVSFDVEEMLDPNDLQYLDVLLALARAVNEAMAVSDLGYTPEQVQALLDEVWTLYQQDRGRTLLRGAFPDWP